jgi:hypothetical protein
MRETRRHQLSHALTEFFHRELDRRYARESLEGIPELRQEGVLQAVQQERIDEIKEFFKRVMYPLGEEREARDRGVETVASILSNTSSLISLLPQLPTIILRHGGRLPAIASAGLTVVTAYRLARHTEEKVLRSLEQLCEEEDACEEGEEVPYAFLRKAYGSLSREETHRTLEQTEKVVRLGMDKRLMEATIEIVEIVRKSREDPQEEDALGYVSSVLREVRSLAERYSRDEVEEILRLSEITEDNYFGALREEA